MKMWSRGVIPRQGTWEDWVVREQTLYKEQVEDDGGRNSQGIEYSVKFGR